MLPQPSQVMGCGSSRAVQQADEEVRQVDVKSKGVRLWLMVH